MGASIDHSRPHRLTLPRGGHLVGLPHATATFPAPYASNPFAIKNAHRNGQTYVLPALPRWFVVTDTYYFSVHVRQYVLLVVALTICLYAIGFCLLVNY